jgi:hypothetical protein
MAPSIIAHAPDMAPSAAFARKCISRIGRLHHSFSGFMLAASSPRSYACAAMAKDLPSMAQLEARIMNRLQEQKRGQTIEQLQAYLKEGAACGLWFAKTYKPAGDAQSSCCRKLRSFDFQQVPRFHGTRL